MLSLGGGDSGQGGYYNRGLMIDWGSFTLYGGDK